MKRKLDIGFLAQMVLFIVLGIAVVRVEDDPSSFASICGIFGALCGLAGIVVETWRARHGRT